MQPLPRETLPSLTKAALKHNYHLKTQYRRTVTGRGLSAADSVLCG